MTTTDEQKTERLRMFRRSHIPEGFGTQVLALMDWAVEQEARAAAADTPAAEPTDKAHLERILGGVLTPSPAHKASSNEGPLSYQFQDGTRLSFLCGPSTSGERLNGVVVDRHPSTRAVHKELGEGIDKLKKRHAEETTTLDRLKREALEATQGEWILTDDYTVGTETQFNLSEVENGCAELKEEADARHIARYDPKAVVRLLDALMTARNVLLAERCYASAQAIDDEIERLGAP